MGLIIPGEIELPETERLVSNVYVSYGMRSLGAVPYSLYMRKEANPVVGLAPNTYIVTNTLEFWDSPQRNIRYEEHSTQFYFSQEEMDTVPVYKLIFAKLKQRWPNAIDA